LALYPLHFQPGYGLGILLLVPDPAENPPGSWR
jgi:hypothetical protein